jgi:N-acetylglutamate synthase-like GNAT family acetyltransferase
MNRCVVREATDLDAAELKSVSESAIATLRETYRPTAEAIAHRDSIVEALAQLVGVIDGKVVGSVEYHVEDDRVRFLSLFVHEDYRHRGVGRSLVDELEQVGKRRGLRCLSAYTVTQTGNPEVFQRMGFDVVSEEPADIYESERFESLTEVYMVRSIK